MKPDMSAKPANVAACRSWCLLAKNTCSDADGLMSLKDACARKCGEKTETLEGVRRAC